MGDLPPTTFFKKGDVNMDEPRKIEVLDPGQLDQVVGGSDGQCACNGICGCNPQCAGSC